MILNIYVFAIFVFGTVEGLCWPGSKDNWTAWEACNATCGGGTQHRSRYVCVYSNDHENRPCNQNCYNGGTYYWDVCHCTTRYYGKCCADWRPCWNNNGGCSQTCSYAHGSGDSECSCRAGYRLLSNGYSCTKCAPIANCRSHICSSASDTTCDACYDDKYFFKVTSAGKKCDRMCARNKHYCWPGVCEDELTKNCQCAPGFTKVSNIEKTLCQPLTLPSILECDTTANGPGNTDKKRTLPGKCDTLKDFYGRFRPAQFTFRMTSDFTIDISSVSKPTFIEQSNFGISDTTVYIIRQSINGSDTLLSNHTLLKDTANSTDVEQPSYANGTIDVSSLQYTVQNGERLCIKYEAKGGGFLKSMDTSSSVHKVSVAFPYTKTSTAVQICYRYDTASPEHCLEHSKCTKEPIQIDDRDIITRTGIVQVQFDGWMDPKPIGGNNEHASGIESYQLTVLEVEASTHIQKVSSKAVQDKTFNITDTSVTLNLTSDRPKLYCLKLEVKDVADNVRHARRFVLFDNSSLIGSRGDKQFTVTSASASTNYTWQTHHNDICISWKDYIYNKIYTQPYFLNAIEADTDSGIVGVYEQTNGLLPVSGTSNIDGIIKFMFLWSLNDGPNSAEETVPNLQNQSYCKHFDLRDGQMYSLGIRCLDIANNTYIENRTVHIAPP